MLVVSRRLLLPSLRVAVLRGCPVLLRLLLLPSRTVLMLQRLQVGSRRFLQSSLFRRGLPLDLRVPVIQRLQVGSRRFLQSSPFRRGPLLNLRVSHRFLNLALGHP